MAFYSNIEWTRLRNKFTYILKPPFSLYINVMLIFHSYHEHQHKIMYIKELYKLYILDKYDYICYKK